jgi:hypothetical protein
MICADPRTAFAHSANDNDGTRKRPDDADKAGLNCSIARNTAPEQILPIPRNPFTSALRR